MDAQPGCQPSPYSAMPRLLAPRTGRYYHLGVKPWPALVVCLLAPALCITLAAACGGDDEPPDATSTVHLDELGAPEDPGLVHVHGLGIDPATGILYAATHTGLFRIQDGKAERVGDRLQDTMGFTIDDLGRFLGSGHPDLRDLRSGKFQPLLGLIESADEGATWESISLSGQADFHALEAAHGRIYGYNATTQDLMVSTDGKRWETRGTRGMYDFAVSPHDPEHLLAALAEGLAESRNGGKTWAGASAGPALAVAWTVDGQWAITPAGAVLFRASGGDWETRGSTGGAPEALLAHEGRLLVAVRDAGILSSSDGGHTWTSIVQP